MKLIFKYCIVLHDLLKSIKTLYLYIYIYINIYIYNIINIYIYNIYNIL